MTDLHGKTALVTGAAQGMGRDIAERFASRGAELLLVDIAAERLEQTASDLERRGHDVEPFVCDLSEHAQIEQLRDDVRESGARVDILVNNAGVVQGGPYEEVDKEADQLMLDVNILGVHRMTKAFLTDLKRPTRTHLVQMASAAGFVGLPYQVLYSASKWFVIGFSEALRLELKERGYDDIGMTIVCPSLVDTGMFEGSEPPVMTPMLEPDFVADRVLEAVESDDLYIKEPFMVKTIPILKALLPTDVVDALGKILGTHDIMEDWKNSA